MSLSEELLFLSEEDVLALFTPRDAIAMAEETFFRAGTGEITVGNLALMYVDAASGNNFHSMPSVLHYKNRAGVKWINTYPAPMPGYPFSHGNLLILSDTLTASPIAVVGVTNITTMRTAGGHGVVQAQRLANPEPRVLTVFGCGGEGKAGMRGFLEGFPTLRRIQLFSRSRGPMEAMRAELRDRVDVVLCASPEEAVRGSDLILMASGAMTPLLTWEMLRPGTTVIGIEGFRDMDPRIGKLADKWFLGFRKPDVVVLEDAKFNPGLQLRWEDVYGDMAELLTQRIPGREREDEIIVSTHMGMGAHDVNCADLVYRRALECGRGQKLILA